MIETAILGLLKDRTMHGYEIKKELTAQLGQFWQFSYGALYPAIRRLEKAGALQRIFPKSQVKRKLNIYKITPSGEELFAEHLAEDPGIDDARFSMKFAFFRYINPTERVHILERRRAYLTEKAAELRDRLRSYREKIDKYTLQLMEHSVDTNVAEIEWVETLLQEEKKKSRVRGKAAGATATNK